MGALPRPDIPPGPHRELVAALHELHHRAGWPSLRRLARDVGCSHTTISNVFTGHRLPPWGVVELLVEAMAGDVADVRELWLAAGRPDAPDGAPDVRIAGRRAELEVVRRHVHSGTGMVVVTGEAGIGKTALVCAAVDGAEAYVATGACRPLSTEVPLLPVTQLLRQVRREQPEWFDRALSECPTYVTPALAQVLPELTYEEAPQVSEEWARQRLFNAVEDVLSALRVHRPLAVVVEDAHWADSTTLDLLELLGSHRCAMLVTVRTDDPEVGTAVVDWLSRVRRLPGTITLALAPLSLAETSHQLALLRGAVPSPDEVARIHARSLGQPLFTEQLELHPDERPLPELLAQLLRRRLRDLGPDAWSVARALGVSDRPLTVEELTQVAGTDPVAGLRELDRQRLLAAADGPLIRLRHPLVAEAIRQHLVSGEAPEVHRRVATMLGASVDPPAAEIADHWASAGDDGRELHWRILAARAAGRGYAVEAAATQWRRVLALWPDDLDRVDDPLLTRAGMFVGVLDAVERVDFDELAPLMDRAMRVAQRAAPEEAAAILTRLGQYRGWLGEPDTHLELTSRAVELLGDRPPCHEHVLALHALRSALEGLGRLAEAGEVGLRILDEARRLGTPAEIKTAMAQQAWAQSAAGDPAGARATIKDLASIELDPPDPYCEIGVAVTITDILLMTGAPARELLDAAGPALAAADEWGLHQWEDAILRSNVVEALIAQGCPGRAWDLVGPYTEGLVTQERWPLHEQRSLLELMRGDLDAAQRQIQAVAQGPLARGGLAFRLVYTAASATISLWRGEPAAAWQAAVPVLESGTDTDEPSLLAPVLVLAARAAADLRDPACGERLHRLRNRLADDPFAPRAMLATATALGATWDAELARLSHDETLEVWAAAATAWDDLTHPYDAAYCRWRGAQVALARGQGTAARRLSMRAAADARGHLPLSEAIRRTAGGPPRQEPDADG